MASVDLRGLPPGFVRKHGELTLLGGAIGGPLFCDQHAAQERVAKAAEVMQAISELADTQTALLLLRRCASFCKVVFAAHVTPPALHARAMQDFDNRVRACLEELGGLPLSQAAWQQASLKIASGGLGLRSAARHSSAAYVASVSSTAASCQQLDANYRVDLAHAVQVFNACVPAGRALPVPAAGPPAGLVSGSRRSCLGCPARQRRR